MPKCTSKSCGFENPDSANYCGKCGLDLSINELENKGRDMLLNHLKKLGKDYEGFTDEQKKMLSDLNRGVFDRFAEKNVGKIYLLLMDVIADLVKETDNKQEKADPLELEKEKLKILKDISENLKKMNKKK